MPKIPNDRRYTTSHEWIKREADGFVVGITEHAQHALGDVVFIDLPELNSQLCAGDDAAVVESVKAASDVYAPVTGTIVTINEAVNDAPQLINQDCYHDGWLFKIVADDSSTIEQLLDADAYAQVIGEKA